MPLDPQVALLLRQLDASNSDSTDASPAAPPVAELRRQSDQMAKALAGPAEPVQHIRDLRIPGPGGAIPLRLYTPAGNGPFPVLVYFHGGGWVFGSVETHDSICRSLANRAGCLVASVDYRLAPEHKFPAAVEDCYAATQWVSTQAATLQADPARMAVGGDSAGANLAAVVALLARERGTPPLGYQVLIYPVTDYYVPGTASYQDYAEGYFATKADMIWCWQQYLTEEAEGVHPYAAPLRAADLSHLPPALVITAEYDPLRDEGEQYARRLQAAGVPTRLSRYEGTIHSFFRMAGVLEQGRQAHQEVGSALRAAFVHLPFRSLD